MILCIAKKKKPKTTENGATKAMVNVLAKNVFIFYENTSLEEAKKTKKTKMLMQDVWYPSELVINYTLNIFFSPKLRIGHLLTFPAVLDEQ